MESLGGALEAAGTTVQDVYRLVYYKYNTCQESWAFLQRHRPATTLVTVPALASPHIKFEIEVYAAVRQEPLRKFDVIVVGAGLSGLKAAWEVQKSEIYKLAQMLKLELVVQRSDGDLIFEDLDGGFRRTGYGLTPDARQPSLLRHLYLGYNSAEPNAAEAIRLITREIENSCHKLDIRDPIGTGEGLDKLTLLEWAKTKTSSNTALAVVNMWMRAIVGIEASEITGHFLRANNFSKSITFDPPLPSWRLKLAEHGVQSFPFKNIVIYSEPWWRKAGLSGALMSFKGPLSTSRDTRNDRKGHYSPTCFTNGEFGRQLCKYPRAERTKAILTDIERVFGPYTKVPDPIGVAQRTWSKDLWSWVCTDPVSPPGITTLHEHALRATHGKVHFVCTETAYECKGYMYGAVISGERGAKEVIQALSEAKL
ncbi:FAD binding domain-containing protein [Aspergillus luchuensis]|uniref:monoamine oxidase n=1 Tax=Aspergillus kawachii TaxID=1069201 RepID=A0A146F307_ASPKA|nr:FAD binding domain-containing protein [Aspergillus luchuensis]